MRCAPCEWWGLKHCTLPSSDRGLGAWGQVGNEPHGFGKAAASAPSHSCWCLSICCHPVLMLFVDGACFHLRKLLGTSLHQQDSLCFGGSFLLAVLSTGRDLSNGDTGFPCGPLLCPAPSTAVRRSAWRSASLVTFLIIYLLFSLPFKELCGIYS